MEPFYNLPEHLAIIMDGNGRWAQARNHNRFWGHIRGAKRARQIIEQSYKLGIRNLTLFAFSTENWNRPATEVSFLMKLLKKSLSKEIKSLVKNNIKFQVVGNIERIPEEVKIVIESAINETSKCNGMNLLFALSYGGKQDICGAIKEIAHKVENGKLKPEQISEELISKHLSTSYLKDPDFIIRTSNEKRLSNFFLWQSAYSELYFTPVDWPDFDSSQLNIALDDYAKRTRRFGMTNSQINEKRESITVQ